MAVGGLLLVFALWWAYFKHEPDIGHHRSLTAMIGWGYGHYFVFAAVAALGAGLQVAADTTHEPVELSSTEAAATVAVPVAIYLVALAFLHARPWTASVLAPILVACALMLAATLAAPVVGVPVVGAGDRARGVRAGRRDGRASRGPPDRACQPARIACPSSTNSTSVAVSTATVPSLVIASSRAKAAGRSPAATNRPQLGRVGRREDRLEPVDAGR